MQTAAPFFIIMKKVYYSDINFTVVPADFSNPNAQHRVLEELFGIDENEKVYSTAVEVYGVKVLYSKPSDYSPSLKSTLPLPSVVRYLIELQSIKDYNKLIAEYNKEKGIFILTLAAGEQLLIANGYKATDFGSVIYFILEALRQNQINPQQTVVNLYAAIGIDELEKLESYVKGVKICAL